MLTPLARLLLGEGALVLTGEESTEIEVDALHEQLSEGRQKIDDAIAPPRLRGDRRVRTAGENRDTLTSCPRTLS